LGSWYWSGLHLSADGSRLVAISNNVAIYVSTNSGASWNLRLTPGFGGQTFGPVVASADGTKLAVAGNSLAVLTSTNWGQTWVTNFSPSSPGFTSMAGSADARMLVANFEFSFYLSTNSGASWTNISSRLPPTEVRSVGCAAADGSVWVIMADAGLVISTNSGATWSLNYYNGNPIHALQVASSADGTKFIAAQTGAYPGGIYLSANTGATWQYFTNGGPPSYYIAASADGCQTAASGTNGIYLLQSLPSPILNLAPVPAGLTLAWTVPSADFILQQSTDLISWASVTNRPTFNSAALQNQVSLPVTNGSGFYRLAAP
jgi:photosystem II stability/assembly factor-like uncharacterized protein